MSHVLIVDDEPTICWGFREFLTEAGHDVSVAASAEEAFRVVAQTKPDAVVLDVRLPGLDGLSAIERFRELIGDVPIIVITAFGNLETAVRAVREGAFEYLPKPFDLDQAAEIVERALEVNSARRIATGETVERSPSETLVGSSPAMQDVFKKIALAAAADVPVLITGESGTGKELVARAIHSNSVRQAGPFLPVCLAALSPGVVESELFGHVKGAFTGATHDRRGLLELADGGTVLLDEIADTTTGLQVKLLRAIEQHEVTAVGDARLRPVDVRILAATNRPIPELIASGDFREDLYFRLSVFHIEVPPLRDRRDDIPALSEFFLRKCRPAAADCRLSDVVLTELSRRDWTGNVRELRNVVEHAAIVSRGNPIQPEHLPPAMSPTDVGSVDGQQSLEQQITDWAAAEASIVGDGDREAELYERFLQLVEPPLLRAVLEHCNNNRAAAAQKLGMHRTTLRQKLRRHKIE